MVRDLGFAGSAGLRLAGAMVFALLAAAAVLVVERQGDAPAVAAPTIVTPSADGHLVLVTTFPVARWTVQVQGHDLSATSVTAQRWEATTTTVDLATIFVQAEPEDPTGTLPGALRWTFAAQSGVLWGEGAVAGTLTSSAGAR